MIERKKYLNELIAAKNNGFPKVITGVRRSGKSYLLREIFFPYLISTGVSPSDVLEIDLTNIKNATLRDPIILNDYVLNFAKGKKMAYVFIDEIQEVFTLVNPALTKGEHILAKQNDSETVGFVDLILGLSSEKNIDLYVTGSNSKMLSSDIVTEFRDKATNIHLSPLSFGEFYEYVGGSKTDALNEYIQYGGMPLSVLSEKTKKKEYLKGLFKTTYFRDILEHNNLGKADSLDVLCNVLSESVGGFLNAQKIANTYRSVAKENINKETVEKYIGFFEDSYLLSEARRFDIKGRKEIGALKKYYFTDVGLRNARSNDAFSDQGSLLENIIYNELIYHGYSVNVGTFERFFKDGKNKTKRETGEIDFYASKGNARYYIQVCLNLNDAKTREREIAPFLFVKDGIQKIVVIKDDLDESYVADGGYTLIGAPEFMLDFLPKRD